MHRIFPPCTQIISVVIVEQCDDNLIEGGINRFSWARVAHDTCAYRLGEGSGVRAVRLREGVLVAPEGGWKDRVYVVLIHEKSPEGVC